MSTPPPTPQMPAPEAPVAKPKPRVLGIIAFVAAVIGFIFACIPGALIIGWILLPIAFVLSLVALFLRGGKWPAITGLILSIVGTIVGFIVFFAVVAGAASTALNTLDKSTPAPNTTTSTAAEAAGSDQSSAADSEYAVTIGTATQTKDYEGKPALVVMYHFTNNSDKAANFLTSVSAKAFQNGVEDDLAILMDDKYSNTNSMKDVKPGVSVDVPMAYLLNGTSEVSVEVTDLFSFDDSKIATKTFSVK